MRINKDNYESFLVDYTEGILSAKIMQEVDDFLLLNPDIKAEFDLFNSEAIEVSSSSYSDKESLKNIPYEKTLASSDSFQQLCIDYVDNQMNENEYLFFEKLISGDKDKKKELELFEKTKLQSENVQFNEKLFLKRNITSHIITNDNFEEYCVASMEGWLDLNALTTLNNFIDDNPNKKAELDLFYKTKLNPDSSIVYPDKSKIKRFTILTPAFKKYLSVVSAAAAIIVFTLMIFNTNTVDDKSQLTGHILNKVETELLKNPISENKKEVSGQKGINEDKKEGILHDPFGFEKINSSNSQIAINEPIPTRIIVEPIASIKIDKIECPPCNQVFENKKLAKNSIRKDFSDLNSENNNQKNTYEEIIKENVKTIAQTGLTRMNNKLKNGRLKVKKNDAGDKTLIAFNSKYFSISTNVKSRN